MNKNPNTFLYKSEKKHSMNAKKNDNKGQLKIWCEKFKRPKDKILRF